MPAELSLRRRVATASRWPAGIVLTSWRYMWRTTPMTREEIACDWEHLKPPPLPDGVGVTQLQTIDDGAGPLFNRRYVVRIAGSDMAPEELIVALVSDLDQVAPTEFASFEKTSGREREMRVGEEYDVRMAGPYDGPVRVLDRGARSFRLGTLEGHLEAGQIEFRCDRDDGCLRFTIESWARSADRTVDVLYSRLRMAKEVQLHMWTSLLERTIELSGGKRAGRLEIITRRAAPAGG